MLTLNVVTLFPEMFQAALQASILGRAAEQGLVRYRVVPLRAYTHDRHKTVDDSPYGGGAGMVQAGALLRGGGGPARRPAARAPVGARAVVHARRRGALLPGARADAVVRPLQGRGPAGGGRAGGGGAVDRRFRAVGRRACRAVRDRRGGAAAPRGVRRPRVGGDGLALRRLAEPAELHAAAELSRNGCAGGIVERRPRADRGLAGGGSGAADARTAARFVGETPR